jgi:hypothetical protein
MMRSPERVSLCAIAAALMLCVLLSGPAGGATQRHCPTKTKGQQTFVCPVGVSRHKGQTARHIRARHGIRIELGGSAPLGN